MPSRPADPHGWNSWHDYLDVHASKLATYADHFLVDDRLKHTLTGVVVWWTGELMCADGYELRVRKKQDVEFRRGVAWVRTATYSYQALHRRAGVARRLFRYDNIHPHHRHPTPHHRHRFDPNGVEILPVTHIGAEWPNLGQVVDELYGYWEQRR